MRTNGLELLEFPKLRRLLADLTGSHLGRLRLEGLRPFEDPDTATETLGLVAGLLRRAEGGNGLPPIEVPDLGAVFRRLEHPGSRLDPGEFLGLGVLLATIRVVRGNLEGAEDLPAVAALAAPLRPVPHLERAIERIFDPSGAILDGASPELRRIRRERERLRERLRSRLERLAAKVSGAAGDSVVTLRDGRYVLSVPVGQKGKVPGLVQDRSGSGQTVFLEPFELVEENNALRECDAEEREEIRRILEALTADFAVEREPLHEGWEHLGWVDTLRARVGLARRWGGEIPELVTGPVLRLTGARHPLLLEARGAAVSAAEARAAVVPLDLELDAETRILLVTGPNMGGKTVALKCVGLLSVMAQCGCLIPADPGCRLPWVRHWVVDVGDEQSLEQDLSTFGARLKRWAEALDAAGPETMVLLDELGTGTDPLEGTALAQSVLERLVEAGGLGVVTTHLGGLKGFAAETEGIRNASMVFDADTRRPVYRLAIGVPGESHALDMARRLGFPLERVERALELLPEQERDLRRLLADLDRERQELARTRKEAEALRREASEAEREARDRLQRFLDERSTLRARAARQAREILRRAEEQAKVARKADRGRGAAEAVDRRALAREQARLARLERPREKRVGGRVPDRVAVGETYWAEGLGREVEVLRVDDDGSRVLVGHHGLKVEMPRTALRIVDGSTEPREEKRGGAVVSLPDTDSVPGEVDLRGMRADEALGRLEQAVDRSLLAGHKEVRIIHGKGTGALQRVVEEYCRSQPAIASFRVGGRGEGGSGATVIVLEA